MGVKLIFSTLAMVALFAGGSAISCYSCSQFNTTAGEECTTIKDCTRKQEKACFIAVKTTSKGSYYQSGCALQDPAGCTCEHVGCQQTKDALQCCDSSDCNRKWTVPEEKKDESETDEKEGNKDTDTGEDKKDEDNKDEDKIDEDKKDNGTEYDGKDPEEGAVKDDKKPSSSPALVTSLVMIVLPFVMLFLL